MTTLKKVVIDLDNLEDMEEEIISKSKNLTIKDNIEMEKTPSKMFIEMTNKIKEKEKKDNIWEKSEYETFTTLTSNNRGVIGENFINEICKKIPLDANICGLNTKGQSNDGTINKKTIEIKTAYLGNCGSFQHELGEEPWKPEYMIFVDITPKQIYITVFKNFDEKKYKSGDKLDPYFSTKQITWRKGKGAFKLDTNEKINNDNVKKNYCKIITDKTDFKEIGEYFTSLFK
jgi:hypothetical protein